MTTNPAANAIPQPLSVAAVLLAAGAGARMGYKAKSLLELDGAPLIRRQIMALQSAGVTELVVVLGHHASEIAPLLQDFAVALVTNPNTEASPVASQRLGLQSLSGQTDAVLMALADQPLINEKDVRQLMDAFKQRPEGTALLFPRVQGQPGNPVIFTEAVRSAILACQPEVGCKQWRQQHSSQVHVFDCENPHFVQDVDTPEDIEKLRQSHGHQLQWPTQTLP